MTLVAPRSVNTGSNRERYFVVFRQYFVVQSTSAVVR